MASGSIRQGFWRVGACGAVLVLPHGVSSAAVRGDLDCDDTLSLSDVEPFAFAVLYPGE